MKNQIYVDLFEMRFFGEPLGRIGFEIRDDAGQASPETYDEWTTVTDFLESFPTKAALIEFLRNETGYAQQLRAGLPLSIRGDAVWSSR